MMAIDEMTERLPMTPEERDAIYEQVMESLGREAKATFPEPSWPLAVALALVFGGVLLLALGQVVGGAMCMTTSLILAFAGGYQMGVRAAGEAAPRPFHFFRTKAK